MPWIDAPDPPDSDPAWLPPLAIALLLTVGTWAALPYLSELLAGAPGPGGVDSDVAWVELDGGAE